MRPLRQPEQGRLEKALRLVADEIRKLSEETKESTGKGHGGLRKIDGKCGGSLCKYAEVSGVADKQNEMIETNEREVYCYRG